MLITGEEYLLSESCKELFQHSLVWIERKHRLVNQQVNRVDISPKLIGRNSGFILEISVVNLTTKYKYFAKVQYAHIGTVFVHHLLKNLQCGPEDFLVTTLSIPRVSRSTGVEHAQHGVVTSEVIGFTMASALSSEEISIIVSNYKQLVTNTFLLTWLIEVGYFANIPRNRDNWGFVKSVNPSTGDVHHRLVVVDFSHDGTPGQLLRSKARFEYGWRSEDYFSSHNSVGEVNMEDQMQQFGWLRNKRALNSLLQTVCNATQEWLLQDIH